MKKGLLLVVFLGSFVFANAQFVNGLGFMPGVTFSNQKLTDAAADTTSAKKYVLGFSGTFFMEFFEHKYLRWQSELQYSQKGAKQEFPNGDLTNKLQYASWNNYLKVRYEMLRIIPFVLVGARLEYKLAQDIELLEFTDKFEALHGSFAVGGGVEFVSFGNIKFIADVIYNPDFTNAYSSGPFTAKNNNFEARLGLKYQFKRASGACNVPR